MDRRELLDLYEATGDEDAYAAAKPLYEQAIADAESGDATVLREYGYLLECHAQHWLRRAVAQYERALEVDPGLDKARYQLIHARAAMFDTHEAITLYRRRCRGPRRRAGAPLPGLRLPRRARLRPSR
jgi:tetratricopeptide (TPR) repeat protein